MDHNIDFIARHYRRGRFSTEAAWRRMGIVSALRRPRLRAAAAIAALFVLSASAAVLYHIYYPSHPATPQAIEAPAQGAMEVVRIIDFENAPLADVVNRIEELYGVSVQNLPPSAHEYVLSLRYEGTAADLIDTINDILGTEMTVAEP